VKIRADEHVSLEIVRAVRDIALTPPFELSHVFDDGHGGLGDVSWVTKFANAGGRVILSADGDFLNRPHQVMAIWDKELVLIHLPSRWQNAKRHEQAAHILLWWDRIEKALRTASPRQCWRVPYEFSREAALTRISVDYGKAQKKVRKAERRTEAPQPRAGPNNGGQPG
jgi:PIN domain-containing protein